MNKLNNFIENLKQNDLKEIDLKVFFNWSYLTDMNPSKHFIYEQWIYVLVLINLIISGLGFFLVSRKFFDIKPRYRFIRKVSFFWFSNTMILLLYNLVRSEGVSLLSMRLILLLILFIYIGIFLYMVLFYLIRMPKELEDFNSAKIRDRYNRNKKKD